MEGYTHFPKPVQTLPPIYASAGGTRDSFRWAGERGLHLGTALFLPDTEALRSGIALYRESLVAAGHDPGTREVMAITQMYCAEDPERALAAGSRYAEAYYRYFADLCALAGSNPVTDYYARADAADMNEQGLLLLGTPEQLCEKIARHRDELGVDFLLLEVAQGGAPHEEICGVLESFAGGVLPAFQASAQAGGVSKP